MKVFIFIFRMISNKLKGVELSWPEKKLPTFIYTPFYYWVGVVSEKGKRDHVQLLVQYFANKGLWVLKTEMYGCRLTIIQIYAPKQLCLLHLWLHLLGHLEQRIYLIRVYGSWQKYRLPVTPLALPGLLCSLSYSRECDVANPQKACKEKEGATGGTIHSGHPQGTTSQRKQCEGLSIKLCVPGALSILLPKSGGPCGVKILILSLITDRMKPGWVGADLE